MSAFTGRVTLAAARRAFQQQRSIHAGNQVCAHCDTLLVLTTISESLSPYKLTLDFDLKPRDSVRNNLISLLPEDMDVMSKETVAYDVEMVKRDLKI
jgi:hypothetical protein